MDTNETALEAIRRRIEREHKPGCSCGNPECPQWQADAQGIDYYQALEQIVQGEVEDD